MPVYRIEVAATRPGNAEERVLHDLREAGLQQLESVALSRLFFLEGQLPAERVQRVANELLADPVTERATVLTQLGPVENPEGGVSLEIHPRPGVMDPVALSTHAELSAEQLDVDSVRTGRRLVLRGPITESDAIKNVGRVLANDCIEEVVLGTAGISPSPKPPIAEFDLRHVPLRELSDDDLRRLSREAHLFLSVDEMRAIQAHFRDLGREPTDLELETLAQTWSEHCVHKTLKSAIAYRGAPIPTPDNPTPAQGTESRRYDNLLKETIARATEELTQAGRGPDCLSVFVDNAGVIAFDDDYGIAFKVETHNHPSAIEPYGGAATGIGGVIRDVIGCGLGAKPVANTDVFCVGPFDWPYDRLPKGVLHPWRVLRGIVSGVADYGNRMGIPTVNGAVVFDPRYLGNPLVYCGCVGLIRRDRIQKAACPGDHVVVVGGRTGRDGIHGATFSSAELTDSHADEFSHAVQIGNAITEKRFLDAILRACDDAGRCLYSAITDCGAGGLSSAVGEMGENVGAVVDLDTVPLKYAGLRYDEIWISEAQERMVLAVPDAHLDRVLRIMADEEVEATVIGRFGHPADGAPRIELRYQGTIVGDLDMHFLHNGVPKIERVAEWTPTIAADTLVDAPMPDLLTAMRRLPDLLCSPNTASKAWIIRQYDHEVQGGSVVKPLGGPGRGPGDAAVVRPRLDSVRAVAVGCGLAPELGDVDPYWMAIASIDEAIRNVVCVGGDPNTMAILDNFCWGSSDAPDQLGALVRACQACYDAATVFGVPFISGKDSLNNEFALDPDDVEPLIAWLESRAVGETPESKHLRRILPGLIQRIRDRQRLAIPATLLISAISIIDDARQCLTPGFKRAGERVLLVGGLPQLGCQLAEAAAIHRGIARLIRAGRITACHDVSDGGWLVAAAEMAIAGDLGLDLSEASQGAHLSPLEECCAGYVIAIQDETTAQQLEEELSAHASELGVVQPSPTLHVGDLAHTIADLRESWSGGAARQG